MAVKEAELQVLRKKYEELLEMFKMTAVANQWLKANEVMHQTESDCELLPAVYQGKEYT